MNPLLRARRALMAATAGVVAFMGGCTSTPPTTPTPKVPPAAAPVPGAPPPAAKPATVTPPVASVPSGATTARDYRRDAANHLYRQNEQRIFKGKLPPLLYAIGVLQVELDGKGRVTGLNWMRAPKHAPEVIKEIERIVRLAAPYPVPARMDHVTYTDTWLWHKSGLFQLDTLTEGQL